jgi:hypothetical protein
LCLLLSQGSRATTLSACQLSLTDHETDFLLPASSISLFFSLYSTWKGAKFRLSCQFGNFLPQQIKRLAQVLPG